METFIIKLAVAVIPLLLLVAAVIIASNLSARHNHRPLAWQRTRRSILRTLAAGAKLH